MTLFEKISHLLEVVNMTPANVAVNLMPKTEEGDADTCLGSLIQALETVREERQRKKKHKESGKEKTKL